MSEPDRLTQLPEPLAECAHPTRVCRFRDGAFFRLDLTLRRWLRKMQARMSTELGGRLVIKIAFSRYASTLLTSGLGFVFWMVAARTATASVVGQAAAVISAMQLIATFCVLGFPTLLLAELKSRSSTDIRHLVVSSIGIAGSVTFVAAIAYGILYQATTGIDEWMYDSPAGIALFGIGAAFTTVVWVLDGALLGVRRIWTQVIRNFTFAVVKLAALPIAAVTVTLSPGIIYLAWLFGNLVSLIVVWLRVKSRREWMKARPSVHGNLPVWRAAVSIHWVNVAFKIPHLVLPIMVAQQLGAAMNAAFYAALLIATIIWTAPMQLGTSLFALREDRPTEFSHGLGTVIHVATGMAILAALGAPFLARPLLGIFGPQYVEAANCLIILGACTFASAVKSIYIAVRRAQGALAKATRALCFGSALEVGAAQLGIMAGNLTAVGSALGAAMVIQTFFFWPAVRQAARKGKQATMPESGGLDGSTGAS